MEQSLAANNNELIKQILERLIQIENNLAFIQQYINDKKKREEARWW
jgi:archaellum component FlaC